MPLAILTTTAFEKDLRRVRKQRKNIDRLNRWSICCKQEEMLPPRCRPHMLHGTWAGHWDCHIEPDWLLLYRLTETELILVRTGSHAELFE